MGLEQYFGQFKLNRRTVLKGAGGIALGLPWLEAMGNHSAAAAPSATAKRFVAVYQPGGAIKRDGAGGLDNHWSPTGTEDAPILSPILAPLENIKHKLLTFDGVGMPSARGEQHQAGMIALLTGTEQGSPIQFAKGPSIDQVIANLLNAREPRDVPSLELAIRWGTGKSKGLLHPINSLNFATAEGFAPIAPRIAPLAIYEELFSQLGPNAGGQAAARLARRLSVLDFVGKRYEGLAARLGSGDKAKLEEHLTKIRALEKRLMENGVAGDACQAPLMVDTSGYDPYSGLNADNDGTAVDASTDAAIPVVGRLMTDMLVMALICNKTSVATLQWSDSEAKHTFPWLDLNEHHHFYQNDGGFHPQACADIGKWYSEQHAYLLQQLDAVDMGGHTLLDETVVYFGSELGHPLDHDKRDVPFMLGGCGGGLKPGRHLTFPLNTSHNNLLISIMNLFGEDTTVFGDPEHCDGPLSGLTV